MPATETRSEQVYHYLLQRMLQNDLKPGDWVDRRRIAEDLNTSLMPVAEAVQRLESEGFLVSVPRRGTQVRVPGREDVRGQLLVREALECQCVRLSCGAPIRAALAHLSALAEQADAASDNHNAAWHNDLAFHEALVERAGCAALAEHFHRVMNLALFQHSALLTPYPFNRGDSHVQLLKDLSRQDADAAEARIRKHIRTGKEHLLEADGPKSSRSV
jgi:DNA-binding GntR family transcriptional regulator